MTEKKKNVCLPKRLIASRKLIGNLAKNDYKKKICGFLFWRDMGFHTAGNHGAFILVCL